MSSQENIKLNSLITNRKLVNFITSSEIETQTEQIQNCTEKAKNLFVNDDIIRNETKTTTAAATAEKINIDKPYYCVDEDENQLLSPSSNVLEDLEFNALLVDNPQINSSNSTNNNSISTILSRKKSKTNYFNINMILYYGRECLCILIFIFTTYATYQNMPPKISITPPRPFFPTGSIVYDWPAGQLGVSQNRVSLSELALVMFYAPWCAESQYARAAYEYVARLYYREVHFAAINCWQPGGECRQQYTKVMAWPVLMAYTQNGLAIPYNGRLTNDALARFVKSLLNPIRRVSTPDELLESMINQDAVVVAFLDVRRDAMQYREFYRAAVKWLEKDPFQEVVWAVVTGRSSENFGIDRLPSVRMYLWNETLEYHNDTWTKNTLNKWVIEKIHQVSTWLTPPGIKSKSFAPYIRRGPVFILFTPRNLNHDFSDAYKMVRQLSLEYYNCANFTNNYWIKEMSRNYITAERLRNDNNYIALLQQCGILQTASTKKTTATTTAKQSCYHKMQTVSVSFSAGIVNSSKLPLDRYCGIVGPQLPTDNAYDNEMTCAAPPLKHIYRNEKCSPMIMSDQFDDDHLLLATSMLTNKYDNRSPDNLFKIAQRKRCEKLFLHDQRENFVFFDKNHEQPNFDLISGLSCKLNQSLSFLVIDSLHYHTFAERLGINIFGAKNKTVAVIMDHDNESTFVQQTPITATSLTQFVYNFLNRKLPRHLKNHLPAKKLPTTKPTTPAAAIVSIKDINSKDFVSNILLSNKTIFVLFYSRQCALCSLMTQHLLYVSNLLSKLHSNIDFVRIDGDQNDLPWQYTMERYPSLVAFANKKAESRIYPASLQITTENVLSFVLANMNRPNRLHALTIICQSIKKPWPFDECLSVLRREITECISYSLKQWRNIARRRDRYRVLRRLQTLQRLYLHLYRIDHHSCDFKALDVYVRNIVNAWTIA